MKPIYEFTWARGNGDEEEFTRSTADLRNGFKLGSAGVELLAKIAREDSACKEVKLVGYEA